MFLYIFLSAISLAVLNVVYCVVVCVVCHKALPRLVAGHS